MCRSTPVAFVKFISYRTSSGLWYTSDGRLEPIHFCSTWFGTHSLCCICAPSIAGLRYEDLLNNSDPVIAEALELADPEVRVGRQRRLKRASDLMVKQKLLPDYAPNMKLEPFKEEIWTDIQKIKARDEEFKLLNGHKL